MSSAAPEYAFATPFLNPPASPIRSLMPYAMRPGTISLAGGYPAQELFDVDGLTIASTQVLARLGACLQYSNIDGQASLRNELARLSAARGLHCNPDTELAVTGGSQQAMALLSRVMLQPGDHAIIESPAFPNSVQALRYTGATVHTVPSGPDGVDIDALDELAARIKPKIVCVVASFSNPCGATISRQRRLRLLELAVKHRFLIVEDDPYSELRFAGEAVPPIMALAEGEARNWAVYLASMSKTMAPALRIGWLVAPPEIRRRCVGAKAADDMASSAWIQEVVAQYLANGRYEEHVPRIRAAYGLRCDAMAAGLERELAGRITFSKPEGGMFFWARLNGEVDATRLLPYAIEHEVVYVPGKAFYADAAQADLHAMRMSFATMNESQIAQGMQRLSRALDACEANQPVSISLAA
ncbi:MAG: PLP-dependent aminotransferase family protein [Achromobacter sp.]|jgi:2-aminoadipate transaminase|uniref:2-aminoadipate transaminase n=1 Tax=Achromobacter insuavis TaxID=1287735 RepID=A0A6J4ZPU4_9BURK|nr:MULTISPECIES: PLP-dependent aminotransferase family protein [Achromobacter]MBN9639983.1 PLP-dependent aminotransferase family protein [Achromobacter sp.]MCG2597906.1 PLP-dependent aminotransferase family protein [Achromobacter sp.]MCG2602047.1 PLP-dependent aminotransferase family protein [Achromobacter sp.]CAB3632030.1 2-aminoadipate transaminase [Achromobacter insuavis]CAB3861096.1 2-aminoadipate transaminase [Achromobacter insuavis]